MVKHVVVQQRSRGFAVFCRDPRERCYLSIVVHSEFDTEKLFLKPSLDRNNLVCRQRLRQDLQNRELKTVIAFRIVANQLLHQFVISMVSIYVAGPASK